MISCLYFYRSESMASLNNIILYFSCYSLKYYFLPLATIFSFFPFRWILDFGFGEKDNLSNIHLLGLYHLFIINVELRVESSSFQLFY